MNLRQLLFLSAFAAILPQTALAADYTIKAGSTDVTVNVGMRPLEGSALADIADIAYNDASLKVYYVQDRGAVTQITTALQTVTGTHTDGGWIKLDNTNAKGRYRLDLPDGVCQSGARHAKVMITYSGIGIADLDIDLVGYDPTAAALPANVTQFNGTNGTFSGGRPEVVNHLLLAQGDCTINADNPVAEGTFPPFIPVGATFIEYDDNSFNTIDGVYQVVAASTSQITVDKGLSGGTAYRIFAVSPVAADRTLKALPSASPAASGGLLTRGTSNGQINATGGKAPASLAAADVSGNLPANVTQFGGADGKFSGGRPEALLPASVFVRHDGNNSTSGSTMKSTVEGALAGSTVVIGPGVFDLGTSTISQPAKVAVSGSGINLTTVTNSATSGNVWTLAANGRLHGLSLKATGSLGSQNVVVINGSDSLVSNCYINTVGQSGYAVTINDVALATLEDCYIDGIANAGILLNDDSGRAILNRVVSAIQLLSVPVTAESPNDVSIIDSYFGPGATAESYNVFRIIRSAFQGNLRQLDTASTQKGQIYCYDCEFSRSGVVGGPLLADTAPLHATTPSRTLDVATTGEAGLDFSNIKQATGATTLNNITVPTVTTLTGHTPQTGDTYAIVNNGTFGNAAIKTAINALPTQTYFNDLFNDLPTFGQAMDGQGYTMARAAKIDKLAPTLFVSTTINTLASQTSFTLNDGPSNNAALNGALVIVTKASDASKKAVGIIRSYTGSTRTVTLLTDPGAFTIAMGDTVDVIAGGPIPLWLSGP